MNFIKHTLVILISIYLSYNSLSQIPLPPVPEFKDAQPEWLYLSQDTNFVRFDWTHRAWTPYNHRGLTRSWLDGDDYYIFEASQSAFNFGSDGFLLHKLNKNTGEVQWICHENGYSDNKYQEDYFIYPLVVHNHGKNIVVFGMQSKDTMVIGSPRITYYSNIIARTIDAETGVIIDEKIGFDTVQSYHTAAGNGTARLFKTQKGELVKLMVRIESDSFLRVNPLLYSINDDLIVQAEPQLEYFYDTGLTADIHSFHAASGFIDENDNIIVRAECINRTLPRYSDNPVKSFVLIFSPDSEGQYHLSHEIDMTDNYFRPDDRNAFGGFDLRDNKLIHWKSISPLSSPVESEYITWCYVYDLDGNLISSADLIHGIDENFRNLQLIGFKSDKLYVSMRFENSFSSGTVIIEIAPGHNNWKEVGRVEVNSQDILYGVVGNLNILDDNALYCPFIILYNDTDGVRKTANYYARFDLAALGITSSTQQEEEASVQVKLYPNPATETIIIDYSGMEQASLIITDLLGQVLNSGQPIIFGENTIDISAYPPGIYFYSLESKNKILTQSQFLKVE